MKITKVQLPRPQKMSPAEERLVWLNENALNDDLNRLAKSVEELETWTVQPHQHASTHASGGSDPVTPASIGAATSSHAHGSVTNGGAITGTTALASGDGIVFADSSDSSLLKRSSITFDGSTDTKALTQKGTWEHSKLVQASSVTNLNNAAHTVNGAIRLYTFTSSSTNSPGYYGLCFFYSSNNPEGSQYAFQTSSTKISHRQRKSDGTWTSWTHIT